MAKDKSSWLPSFISIKNNDELKLCIDGIDAQNYMDIEKQLSDFIEFYNQQTLIFDLSQQKNNNTLLVSLFIEIKKIAKKYKKKIIFTKPTKFLKTLLSLYDIEFLINPSH